MKRRFGFTMIELLVVIAIIAILAAILFPVFARAKAAAKQTACASNLKQIGTSIGLYMADSDDIFPHALDASDRWAPTIWDGQPEFAARIPTMPLLSEVLQPYMKNKDLFKCPTDSGATVLDNHWPQPFGAGSSMFGTYQSSYFFRTEIAFKAFSDTAFRLPSQVNVLFDGAGHWHGSGRALRADDSFTDYANLIRTYRYNTLFGDWHVKLLTRDKLDEIWSQPLD